MSFGSITRGAVAEIVSHVKNRILGLESGTTENHVVTFGSNGYTVKDSGFTIEKSVPADAEFTDTTYSEFVKSGLSATAGLVPAPSTTEGGSKYLCEDGTWKNPVITANYDESTSSLLLCCAGTYVSSSKSLVL